MASGAAAPALGEFELIARFFDRPQPERRGIGDDCALVDVGTATLAFTADLLLEGRHFLPGADPEAVGHKALAVNLSDLAAAGAQPRCFLLSLALPTADPAWLEPFAHGLFTLASQHGCSLIGGDTTRTPTLAMHGAERSGPLTIAITAFGHVERAALRTRGGARIGDELWVSGTVGGARAGLADRRGERALGHGARAACHLAMDRPEPRVALGLALRGLASAAIDVSDGLLGDLAHVLARSAVGATVVWPQVPVHPALDGQPEALRQAWALAGGDDYELLFTAAPAARAAVEAAGRHAAVAVTRIGLIEAWPGLRVVDADGRPLAVDVRGFDHFAPGAA